MLLTLSNFDPVSYLNINITNLSQEQIERMKQHLNGKIGEYVLLKLSNYLTEEQLEQIMQQNNGNEILRLLSSFFSDANSKILTEVENFKKEYLEGLKDS